MILVIDNYDSFTYNLVQALEAAGAELRVVRNDAIDGAGIAALAADPAAQLRGILISPGPADPSQAGVSVAAVDAAAAAGLPLLGVCLGMQAIVVACGGAIVRAPSLVHGEASQVIHDGLGLFAGLPNPMAAARYHSLCAELANMPAELVETARTSEDDVVMGVRHRTLPIEGIQFHPESLLTPAGPALLANFLRQCGEGDPAILDGALEFARRGLAAHQSD